MNYKGGLELQRDYSVLYSICIFGLRVPDDGTVTFYGEIKMKIRTRLDLLSCYLLLR